MKLTSPSFSIRSILASVDSEPPTWKPVAADDPQSLPRPPQPPVVMPPAGTQLIAMWPGLRPARNQGKRMQIALHMDVALATPVDFLPLPRPCRQSC